VTGGPDATTANVWAHEVKVAGNPIRQLLVPESGLDLAEDTGGLQVVSVYGRWPALRGADAASGAPLTARVPVLAGGRARVTWSGSRDLLDPVSVADSYGGAIGFRAPGEPGGLRRPQLGALHFALGYWTSGLADPGIIVMPTGTGKTETMLALLVAARLGRLLVVVPTTALRSQIAAKFETLGVLQGLGVVGSFALRPVVGRLEHGISDAAGSERFAAACNVVVAAPAAVEACAPEALGAFYARFAHLMVDEAHHAPAATWARIIDVFRPRLVLLFTATPYREDGRTLPGRQIFRFPLREAQADGYFTKIDYRAG
jgi:Type III restriction enzyme, res subunit